MSRRLSAQDNRRKSNSSLKSARSGGSNERRRSSVRFTVPTPTDLEEDNNTPPSSEETQIRNSPNNNNTTKDGGNLTSGSTRVNKSLNNSISEDDYYRLSENKDSLITFQTLKEEISETLSVSSGEYDIGNLELDADLNNLPTLETIPTTHRGNMRHSISSRDSTSHNQRRRNRKPSTHSEGSPSTGNRKSTTSLDLSEDEESDYSSSANPETMDDTIFPATGKRNSSFSSTSFLREIDDGTDQGQNHFAIQPGPSTFSVDDNSSTPQQKRSSWGRNGKRNSRTYPSIIASVETTDNSTDMNSKSWKNILKSLTPPKFGRRLLERGFQRHYLLRAGLVSQFLALVLLVMIITLVVFNTTLNQQTIYQSNMLLWFNTSILIAFILLALVFVAPFALPELKHHYHFHRYRAMFVSLFVLLLAFGLDFLFRVSDKDLINSTFIEMAMISVFGLLPLSVYTIGFAAILVVAHFVLSMTYASIFQGLPWWYTMGGLALNIILLALCIILAHKRENRRRANWLNSLELGKKRAKGILENGRKWTLINGILPLVVTRKLFIENKRLEAERLTAIRQEQLDAGQNNSALGVRNDQTPSSIDKERELDNQRSPLSPTDGDAKQPKSPDIKTIDIETNLQKIPALNRIDPAKDIEMGVVETKTTIPPQQIVYKEKESTRDRYPRLDISPRTSLISGDQVCVTVVRLIGANGGLHLKAKERLETFTEYHQLIENIADRYGLMLGPWLSDRFVLLGGITEHEELMNTDLDGGLNPDAGGRSSSRLSNATNSSMRKSQPELMWSYSGAKRAAEFSLDFINSVQQHDLFSRNKIRVKVGMATGPVYGAVVGKSRFSFDVFGPTVNKAKELEASGENSRVHVCPQTYLHLVDEYDFQTVILRNDGIGASIPNAMYGNEVQRTHFLLKRKLATVLKNIRKANSSVEYPVRINPNLDWIHPMALRQDDDMSKNTADVVIKGLHAHLGMAPIRVASPNKGRTTSDSEFSLDDDEEDVYDQLKTAMQVFLSPRVLGKSIHAMSGTVPLWQLVPNPRTIKGKLVEKDLSRQITNTMVKRNPQHWDQVRDDINQGIDKRRVQFLDKQQEHKFMERIVTRNNLVFRKSQRQLSWLLFTEVIVALTVLTFLLWNNGAAVFSIEQYARELGAFITIGVAIVATLVTKGWFKWLFRNDNHQFSLTQFYSWGSLFLVILSFTVVLVYYVGSYLMFQQATATAILNLFVTSIPHFSTTQIDMFNLFTAIGATVSTFFVADLPTVNEFGQVTKYFCLMLIVITCLIASITSRKNCLLLHSNYDIMLKVIKQLRLTDSNTSETQKLLTDLVPYKVMTELHRNSASDYIGHINRDGGVIALEIAGIADSSNVETQNSADVLQCLHDLFVSLDQLVIRHRCTKVKSFGTQYVVVIESATESELLTRMCELAFQMQGLIQRFNVEQYALETELDARIAMYRGTVCAGMVGITRFGFDVMGPAVKTVFDILDNTSPGLIVSSLSFVELLKEEEYVSNLCATVMVQKGRMDLFAIDRFDFARPSRNGRSSSAESEKQMSNSSSGPSLKTSSSPLDFRPSAVSTDSAEKLAALFDKDVDSDNRTLQSASSVTSSFYSHRPSKFVPLRHSSSLDSRSSGRSARSARSARSGMSDLSPHKEIRRQSSNRSSRFKPFFNELTESIQEEDELSQGEEEEEEVEEEDEVEVEVEEQN